MNDYNAMFSYQGVYHLTYQDHINCPDDINQANQSFGHVVTTDLVHLMHLPPILTDERLYDNTLGPWDGPGFICNGVPTVIYNSHANGNNFNQQTKTAATPLNLADRWLTNWSRQQLTPSDAFIGPGTLPPPWKSRDGSKYFAFAKPAVGEGCWLWETPSTGNCTVWTVTNHNFTDPALCYTNSPELWPLPRPCESCPPAPTAGPSHILKYTAGEYDAYVLGKYDDVKLYFTPDGPPKLFEFPKTRQFEDGRGAWSESMLTADGSRRFYIAWVPPGVSPGYKGPQDLAPGFPRLWHTSTVMREVLYDARIKQLTSAPLDEYTNLREDTVGPPLSALALSAGAPPKVLGRSRQFDVDLNFTFNLGDANTSFGVTVFASDNAEAGVRITISCSNGTPAQVLPGTDLPGDDYHWFGVDPSFTQQDCAEACVNDTHCKAWTLVNNISGHNFPPYRCCFKNPVPQSHPNPKCTSGIAPSGPTCTLVVNTTGSGDVPAHTVSSPVATVAAPLLPGERVVSLRVLGDRSIIEAFAVAGRAVATATVYAPAEHTSIGVWAESDNVAVTGQAYEMGCAWILAEDLDLERAYTHNLSGRRAATLAQNVH